MTHYLIADITVTDDAWVPAYAAEVHEIIARHGGRYLSRSGNVEVLEGQSPDSTLIAIIAFPDRAAIDGFLADPAYAAHLKARQDGSVSRLRVIDDTDLAGTIPGLRAA
jgi:uncharacterized protein (DUF1330 family)